MKLIKKKGGERCRDISGGGGGRGAVAIRWKSG